MKHSNGSKAIKLSGSHLEYFAKVTDLALGRSNRRSKPMDFVGKFVRILEDIAKGVKAIHIGCSLIVEKTGFKLRRRFKIVSERF